MKKKVGFKTKGMNQDLSVSAFNPEFSFENINLRLSTNEGNTLMSWVNEKGTTPIELSDINSIQGTVIGTAVINHKLVLFTTDNSIDRIYKLVFNDDKSALLGELKYEGKLGFSTNAPLETQVSYESDTIEKVYWTDGVNQPRVINICADYTNYFNLQDGYNPFDFVPRLQLNEEVHVKKILGGNGMFAPGVIQYAFTYYNKYGQESNIFYTSPLLYISHADRGASPEDKVDNAFKITVNNVDKHFDYLRIYSIQRTSINGTPIVKRIQDIEVKSITENYVSYTDVGISGNTVDPTELLYKGEGGISVGTMEQKGNTLFLGNIKTDIVSEEDKLRKYFEETGPTNIVSLPPSTSSNDIRRFIPASITGDSYKYGNQLTAYDENGYSVPCGGFKKGDYYRCGVQFQDAVGKWSSPIWIKDVQIGARCSLEINQAIQRETGYINVPIIKGSISEGNVTAIKGKGYVKVRPVIVFPNIQDRVTICQGVLNKTMKQDDSSYYQSSWFFRPYLNSYSELILGDGVAVSPTPGLNDDYLEYTKSIIEGTDLYDPKYIRAVEIEGNYYKKKVNQDESVTWEKSGMFKVDGTFATLHSPDLEFDDSLAVMNYDNLKYQQVGFSTFTKTMSDIDIQTETPTISSSGAGFIHKTFKKGSSHGIVSGLFYDDFGVNDSGIQDGVHTFAKLKYQKASMKFLVYPWQSDGSLNNDINRPVDAGTPTAVLKKKVISNLRYAVTAFKNMDKGGTFSTNPALFSSDEATVLKLDDNLYMGNVDTIVSPATPDGKYLAYEGYKTITIWDNPADAYIEKETPFDSDAWGKTFSKDPDNAEEEGFYLYKNNEEGWKRINREPGEDFTELVMKKSGVRMKYKSTPHLVMPLESDTIAWSTGNPLENYHLPIVEIKREVDPDIIFGGNNADALKEATWISCGEPVRLDNIQNGKVNFEYSYGDTYYQRYDCLKTYAFTPEDKNQIVEIGSFMLETHVNIDGRYDRNRGQLNNLNMSPRNFNLLNPVYSQIDNFFSYKIMDEDAYQQQSYPNQVVWSITKESGAEVDAWTHITLASILELDGDKGTVNKLIRLNDQLLCLQDSAISRILYDERVQIATNENVPIEIGNSGKVQGKVYMSNTIGCSNKWSVVSTPAGIYFMDSNDKSIYRIGEGLVNVSQQGGFNSWCKNNIPAADVKWTPVPYKLENNANTGGFDNFVGYYDKLNQDVLYINKDTALAFSEKFGVFTSFYDYGNIPYFCSLDDTGIWIKQKEDNVAVSLWKHQDGNYCRFFDINKPYSMTLVGNPEPQTDKIFTNIEFRACVEGDGESDQKTGKFTPTLPFDSLETWDEYQHGITALENKNGHDLFKHGGDSSALIRKFRIWRCDIPRDNVSIVTSQPILPENPTPEQQAAYDADVIRYNQYLKDINLGISRYESHPNDRMRNPWLYLKLLKNIEIDTNRFLPKAEIHDVVMTYFN